MKRQYIALFLLAAALSALGISTQAQTTPSTPSLAGIVNYGRIASFDGQTAVGQTARFRVDGAQNHSIQIATDGVFDGATPACTYELEGSNDGSNWFDISTSAITCTAAGSVVQFETNKPTMWVRGSVLTYSTTTARTVTLHYVGR